MITEIVMIDLPPGTTRDQVLSKFRLTAPRWRKNPDLIRKNYLYDPEQNRVGGVYLWRDMASAKRAHNATWITEITKLYGGAPTFQYFETPVVVDNDAGKCIEVQIAAAEAI